MASDAAPPFAPGTPIVIRNLARGRVRFAEPAVVVADDPDLVQVYRAAGTPRKVPTSATLGRSDPGHDARSRDEYETGRWDHHDAVWTGTDVLMVARPGAWWSAWLLWEASTKEFLSWYVNFERPWIRTPLGFDTQDLSLDLVVLPDGEVIEKDRDDYDERRRTGLITVDEARQVERANEQARRTACEAAAPFNHEWTTWRPGAGWPIVAVPDGWDVV